MANTLTLVSEYIILCTLVCVCVLYVLPSQQHHLHLATVSEDRKKSDIMHISGHKQENLVQ